MNSHLAIVYQELTKEERLKFNSHQMEIDYLKDDFIPTKEKMNKVNLNRLMASSTLKKMKELEKWDEANAHLHSTIGKQLSFDMIKKLNRVVSNNCGLREEEVFGAGLQYLEFKYLAQEISKFDNFLHSSHGTSPLELALRVYIWICSAHPFKNGNGRTARLIADKILLEAGYLPLCFPDSRSGHIAYFKELNNDQMTPRITVFAKGIIRSYQL